jgi:hypothetical protein
MPNTLFPVFKIIKNEASEGDRIVMLCAVSYLVLILSERVRNALL